MDRGHAAPAGTVTGAPERPGPGSGRAAAVGLPQLLALSERLAELTETSEVAPAVVAALAEAGVAWARVGIELDDERIVLPARLVPSPAGAERTIARDLVVGGPLVATVLGSGRAAAISSEAARAALPSLVAERGVAGAVVLVPLAHPTAGTRGETGAGARASDQRPQRFLLVLGFAAENLQLDGELRDGLTLAGRLVAEAFDRLEERRRSAHGAQRRNLVVRSIAELLPPAPLATIETRILDLAASLAGAQRATLLRAEGEDLVVAAARGADEETVRIGERVPLASRTAVAEAARSGRTSIAGSRDRYLTRYPAMAARFLELGDAAVVALPLVIGERPFGVLGLGFKAELEPTPADLEALAAFAGSAAWALESARLREAEASARRTLESVIAQMPLAVAIADPEGRITAMNGEVERIWGGSFPTESRTDHGRWVGQHADGSRVTPEAWPMSRSLKGEVVDGEEIAIVRFDGERAVTRQWSGPIRSADGRSLGAVAVFADITEEAEATRMRDAFIGVLSHELRTPVTTIYGNAQLLGRPSLMPELRGELISDIAAESDRLLRIVQDLLVIARIERGVPLGDGEPIVLDHFLERAVTAARRLHPLTSVELAVEPGLPLVSGDEGYLEQVMRNLVSNAVKYGRSRVAVTARPTAVGVAVAVADDGPGFAPGELDRVWELFWRGSREGRKPGAGIGLYVSRRLVEAMGGEIEAANGPTGGAVLTVTLRAHAPLPDEP